MPRKILSIIISYLIMFSGLSGVYAQDLSGGENFLSPQLQIQTIDILSACREGYQSLVFIPNPRIPVQENPEYVAFFQKLVDQVGTAEEIMAYIKEKYAAKYGQAIAKLEAMEATREAGYQWVIKHEEEVMVIAYCMGKVLGLKGGQLAQLAIGCRFHDIGKCSIDPGIISDDRVFSDTKIFSQQQREAIRNQLVEHSVKSYDILRENGITDEVVLSIAFYHHANTDGSGYPDPVTRQYIPLEAKIARVADSFSAMLGTRPYNQRFRHTFNSAVEDIRENSYVLYGPRVVSSFLTLVEKGDVSSRRQELYYIPLKESRIFRDLCRQADNIPYIYPLAKVACGISRQWNDEPFCSATNTIGTHRHAEMNLILKVLDNELRSSKYGQEYLPLMRRLEFLAYTEKINKSQEAMSILKRLSALAGDPFKDTVIYVTLRPCGACLEVLESLGIKEVYYGSEHPNDVFIQISSDSLDNGKRGRLTVKRSYFANEGVREPNSLFFALCLNPSYEKLCDSINSWFSVFISNNSSSEMSVLQMRDKQELFQSLITSLLRGIDKDSDLEKVDSLLIKVKKQFGPFLDGQGSLADIHSGLRMEQSI